MINANMDYIGKGGAIQGEVAAYLATQGRINPAFMRPIMGKDGQTYFTVYTGGDPKKKESYKTLRRDQVQTLGIATYATLRRDEWNQLDQSVQQISAVRLGGIQDLIDNNLVYNLGNAMGTTMLEYHSISDMGEASVDMDPNAQVTGDRPNYESVYLPIPVIHSGFEISSRTLAASRSLGNPLDVDATQAAARKVNEKLESLLFNTTGTPYKFGGGYIYSYLDHPKRNLYSLTGNWDASTGANILKDVLGMIQMAINDKHYGPYMLYVPTAYQIFLGNDYVANYPKSTRARVLEIEGLMGIKVIDTLPANNVVLVEMATQTVRLVKGMAVQVVQWQEGSSLAPTKYKVLTIQVPQVRADQAGNCGVVHGS